MKNITQALLLCTALGACGSPGTAPSTSASAGVPASLAIAGSPPPSSGSSSGPSTPSAVENLTFTGLLNGVRASNGSGGVSFDARLTNAAQAHADDMLANNYFSHTGLNGSSAGDRIRAAGYNWRTYGENIAQGQQTEASVMTAWTNSPGHHANNINPNFEDYGLGVAGTGSQKRWVLVLGAE